jgi:adenylate cyclase
VANVTYKPSRPRRSLQLVDAAECRGLVKQIGPRIGILLFVAHSCGAALSAISSSLTDAGPHARGFTGTDVVALAIYLPLTGALGWHLGRRSFLRALAWLEDGRRPTAPEVRRVLRYPLFNAGMGMAPWLGAALLWGLGNAFVYHNPGLYSLRVALSIEVGGIGVCALTYLLTERMMRPLYAEALAGEVPEDSGAIGLRARLFLSWALGADIFLLMIGLTFVGRRHGQPPSAAGIWFLIGTGFAVGTLVLYVAARSLVDPLRDLRRAVRSVQHGELGVEVSVDDGGEIGLLQAGFNQMVMGLRERARLQDLFGRHVGTEVAARALEQGAVLGGERREVSVLFVDLVGSSGLAQRMAPDQVVDLFNSFFATVVRRITAEGGWINKFEGDGALAVFGAPGEQADHAARALRAARTLRGELLALAATHPELDAGIGVSSGVVVAGNIGAEDRYEYTVIGDPVNEAARLSEEAKRRLGRVLVSDEAVGRAGEEGRQWRVTDEITLRGWSEPVLVREPAPSV